jgi:phosphoglycolate phosphatase
MQEINPENIKSIIWDWNGTLLNDAEICVFCMNKLLGDRNLETLNINRYRDIFTFPVKAYYQKAGFDFSEEDFEKPAMEFIQHYYKNLPLADLFEPVHSILSKFDKMGYHQSILSAMEHESLMQSLKDKNVLHYFNLISGINDHYAHSKLEIGIELLEKTGFSKNETLFVGDTIHDYEVGSELGVKVLLIANGHQSKERLLSKTSNVVDEITDVLNYLD